MSTTTVALFTIKRHDHRPTLRLVVTNKSDDPLIDGTPYDFTGAIAQTFLMYDSLAAQKISAGATFDGDPSDGVLLYTWQGTDTDTIGDFSAEFEVDFGSGDKITLPNTGVVTVRIVADLNNA
jgi:hypothetical protein